VDLRAYLAILAKRWMMIVSVFLIFVAIAVASILLVDPTYRATSQLFVSTQISTGNVNQELSQSSNFSSDRVKSYTQLITSPTVLDPVIAELGLQTTATELAEDVQADVPLETVLIDITADSLSPEVAAALANAVGRNLSRVIEDIETAGRSGPSPVRATLVTPALVPDEPHWPPVPLSVALGILVGLMAGIGLALLVEKLDTTVKTADDLAGDVAMPVLAEVSRDSRRGAAAAIVRDDPQGSRSEAYRKLRTNLQFAAVDRAPKIVLVTSALPGEGKSSVAGNLALALSQVGGRVCLVDGDLRRPSVADYFNLVGEAGVSTVIVGRASVDDVLQPVNHGLAVITSGAIPPNPTELLTAPAFAQMLGELRDRFDTIIVDAPPVLPAADAAVLAAAVDGVIFVIRAGRTGRQQVERALSALEQVNARMLGAVLNAVGSAGQGKRRYGYSSDYTYRSEGGSARQQEFLAAGIVQRNGARGGPLDGRLVPLGAAAMADGRPSPRPRRRARNGD
jgi:polysaccharide biosynthesis transport protein